ncbi:MAG: glycine zipper 2TM domain-containing protein [Spartobacteria bacterium]|nr:glycine zipper 2TM domain-containing protein [Spartobacteria bacterium]
MSMKWIWMILAAGGLLLQAGCATAPTPTQQGALLGAGAGGVLGGVLGHNLGNSGSDRDLAIAAGTLLGGLLGYQYGQQSEMQSQIYSMQAREFITTVWVENANGSRTPVQLRQTDGGQYVGPRGEYYPVMPSQQQLRAMYGI